MRVTTIQFSAKERSDLLITWLSVSGIFALASGQFFSANLPIILFVSALTAGIGVIIHELAHKVVAIHRGCSAEFRANNSMLWISLLIALLGVVFIAPGAVHTHGASTKKENGIISLAGPASNIALGGLFLGAILLFSPEGLLGLLCSFGLLVNAWLALFNLIPIPPLDGRAVWVWSKPVYVVFAVLSIILIILSNLL